MNKIELLKLKIKYLDKIRKINLKITKEQRKIRKDLTYSDKTTINMAILNGEINKNYEILDTIESLIESGENNK